MSFSCRVKLIAFAAAVSLIGGCSLGSSRTAGIPAKVDSDSTRIVSFNIHYLAPGQGRLDWDTRKQAVVKAIEALDADIIAFQEMETFAGGSFNRQNKQLDWVLSHFPQYTAGAYGDAKVYPNTQPILFRHELFEQLEQGFFFFSETPDVIYSRTFNGSWPAFCSWSRLVHRRSREELYVFNVHFEYKSMSNRGKSADLVVQRVSPFVVEGKAVVLVGDTNAFRFFPTTRTLKSIPLSLAPPSGPTFHLNRGLGLFPAIDHVFYSTNLTQIGKTHRLRDRYDGVWPADHYPIAVDIKYQR